jgi:hypothetical protein
MSLRALNIVWSAPIKPASLKLVALALADWSNDEGGSLHPSMASIAQKTGVSRCQAQRLVQEMKAAGVLSVVANQFGGDPGATPHYRLHLDALQDWRGSTGATGSADARGSTGDVGGVAPMHKRGSTGATQTTMNHHVLPDMSAPAQKPTRLACPHEQVKALYAELCTELPALKVWSQKRQTALRARWAETAKAKGWKSEAEGLAWFRKFFEAVAASDFLTGRSERKAGHEGWRADFDFLTTPKGFTGVIEGKYTNRGAA